MGLIQSFIDAQERVKAKRDAAPAALDHLIENAGRLHPVNLGLQALVYIEALAMFHPSGRMINKALKEMKERAATIEEARIEITEAIRAFRATLPAQIIEAHHD